MDLIYFAVVFFVIVAIMLLRKPLYLALGAAILVTLILYRIPIKEFGPLFLNGVLGRRSLELIAAFYSITFLQRMMEKRGRLVLAEESVNKLFNSRRVNAILVPALIGFLPSPGAVLIAKPIVDKAAGKDLNIEERAFVTSFYRHISEAFLPTYTSIILALQLSGVSVNHFLLSMIFPVVILILLGYLFYVRKIPKRITMSSSENKKQDLVNLFIGVWPILLAVMLILLLGIPVYLAVIPVIVLYFLVEKFRFTEVKPFFKSAFEMRMILIVIVVMIFNQVLQYTGMISRLPSYLEGQSIPPVLIFAGLMLLGVLVAGGQAMITLVIPLAFAAIPDGGVALLVLLMSLNYIAMQISPTHICLGIICEAYKIPFGSLVKKTLPIMLVFIVFIMGYYLLLSHVI
jgi:integral membrane protein (TIGR00529 family)